MNMKKTKGIQWFVFIASIIVVFALAVAALVWLMSVLSVVLGQGVAMLLVIIVSWGVGALISYSAIQVGTGLADRGWFV
jgi:hypothetical protein